jgi:hydroxymethylpyrimidine pyrophosphatase-like HAD family hydrolase
MPAASYFLRSCPEDTMSRDHLPGYVQQLQEFVSSSRFWSVGAVMTDLDGTAVHEVDGKSIISQSVELGLERVHAAGRQVLVNTLRFPLSIMRVFAQQWRRATGDDMLAVTLNGSLVGRIRRAADGQLVFDEMAAFPIDQEEIAEVMQAIEGLCRDHCDDLLVFYYPREWRQGEAIWTPNPARLDAIRAKYRSASHVFSGRVDALAVALQQQPICMVFLVIDASEDRLMAYQHGQRTRFITHAGVDKRRGALELARLTGVALDQSIGAGDAEPDTFLDETGFSLIVGNQDVRFRGKRATVRVPDAPAFGELLLVAASTTR